MSDETFLARWMRRKSAARQASDAPSADLGPAAPARAEVPPPAEPCEVVQASPQTPPAQAPDDEAAKELPALDSLRGIASDYQDFMRADVDAETRRAALKKLFTDPHFNRMDGLDVYIDDYSKPDPIPAAMLAGLQHARAVLFDEAAREPADDAPPPGLSEVTTSASGPGTPDIGPDGAAEPQSESHDEDEDNSHTGLI